MLLASIVPSLMLPSVMNCVWCTLPDARRHIPFSLQRINDANPLIVKTLQHPCRSPASVLLVACCIGLLHSYRGGDLCHRVYPSMPCRSLHFSLILAPRHPAKNAECYQGSRPLRPVRMSSNSGLATPYVREQGHLMIWPPEHRYRWAGGGCIG